MDALIKFNRSLVYTALGFIAVWLAMTLAIYSDDIQAAFANMLVYTLAAKSSCVAMIDNSWQNLLASIDYMFIVD